MHYCNCKDDRWFVILISTIQQKWNRKKYVWGSLIHLQQLFKHFGKYENHITKLWIHKKKKTNAFRFKPMHTTHFYSQTSHTLLSLYVLNYFATNLQGLLLLLSLPLSHTHFINLFIFPPFALPTIFLK